MMAASKNNHTKIRRPERLCGSWINKKEEVDEEAKRALGESIPNDEKYPPEDLSGWIKTKMASSRQKRWEEGKNAMKERKKNNGWPIRFYFFVEIKKKKKKTMVGKMTLKN
jgi:hypothetical protein